MGFFLGILPFLVRNLSFSTNVCPFSEKIVPFFLVCPLGMVDSSGPRQMDSALSSGSEGREFEARWWHGLLRSSPSCPVSCLGYRRVRRPSDDDVKQAAPCTDLVCT